MSTSFASDSIVRAKNGQVPRDLGLDGVQGMGQLADAQFPFGLHEKDCTQACDIRQYAEKAFRSNYHGHVVRYIMYMFNHIYFGGSRQRSV